MAAEDLRRKSPTRGSSRLTAAASSTAPTYRLSFRLVGIPALAIAGVLLYQGLRDYFVLPECDSARARQTLTDVFGQLNVAPQRFEPIRTVSTNKDEVVCKASLPLADGATLDVDFRFFWQGNKANMKYSISRRPPQSSTNDSSAAARG
jgi:hypothetical protein